MAETMDDVMDDLVSDAVARTDDLFGAAAVLFSGGFTVLNELLGEREALSAMTCITSAITDRVSN